MPKPSGWWNFNTEAILFKNLNAIRQGPLRFHLKNIQVLKYNSFSGCVSDYDQNNNLINIHITWGCLIIYIESGFWLPRSHLSSKMSDLKKNKVIDTLHMFSVLNLPLYGLLNYLFRINGLLIIPLPLAKKDLDSWMKKMYKKNSVNFSSPMKNV